MYVRTRSITINNVYYNWRRVFLLSLEFFLCQTLGTSVKNQLAWRWLMCTPQNYLYFVAILCVMMVTFTCYLWAWLTNKRSDLKHKRKHNAGKIFGTTKKQVYPSFCTTLAQDSVSPSLTSFSLPKIEFQSLNIFSLPLLPTLTLLFFPA